VWDICTVYDDMHNGQWSVQCEAANILCGIILHYEVPSYTLDTCIVVYMYIIGYTIRPVNSCQK
jgi:hypothetical protein